MRRWLPVLARLPHKWIHRCQSFSSIFAPLCFCISGSCRTMDSHAKSLFQTHCMSFPIWLYWGTSLLHLKQLIFKSESLSAVIIQSLSFASSRCRTACSLRDSPADVPLDSDTVQSNSQHYNSSDNAYTPNAYTPNAYVLNPSKPGQALGGAGGRAGGRGRGAGRQLPLPHHLPGRVRGAPEAGRRRHPADRHLQRPQGGQGGRRKKILNRFNHVRWRSVRVCHILVYYLRVHRVELVCNEINRCNLCEPLARAWWEHMLLGFSLHNNNSTGGIQIINQLQVYSCGSCRTAHQAMTEREQQREGSDLPSCGS